MISIDTTCCESPLTPSPTPKAYDHEHITKPGRKSVNVPYNANADAFMTAIKNALRGLNEPILVVDDAGQVVGLVGGGVDKGKGGAPPPPDPPPPQDPPPPAPSAGPKGGEMRRAPRPLESGP